MDLHGVTQLPSPLPTSHLVRYCEVESPGDGRAAGAALDSALLCWHWDFENWLDTLQTSNQTERASGRMQSPCVPGGEQWWELRKGTVLQAPEELLVKATRISFQVGLQICTFEILLPGMASFHTPAGMASSHKYWISYEAGKKTNIKCAEYWHPKRWHFTQDSYFQISNHSTIC